jgi:hypothetical protein
MNKTSIFASQIYGNKVFEFMNTRKGDIFYKYLKDNKDARYVVVDYDYSNVYLVDLNSNNKKIRKVITYAYQELTDKGFKNERLITI